VRRMNRYGVTITFLFLLFLAPGIYGESDDQPKWNTTLFGSYFLSQGDAFGIGGAVAYSFTPRLELEGEIGTLPGVGGVYIVSEGVLYNFDSDNKNTTRYVLGGFCQLISLGDITNTLMFGGGIKMPLTRSFKIRLDLRLHFFVVGWFMRISTGLMWSF